MTSAVKAEEYFYGESNRNESFLMNNIIFDLFE